MFFRRRILQFVNLAHSKRDWDYWGHYVPKFELDYLDRSSEKTIRENFGSFRPYVFLSTENRFSKVFDSTDETKTERYYFDVVSRFPSKKYPEWKPWQHITRLVPTIEWRNAEKVKIRPFCQRKGTTRLSQHVLEIQKSVFGVIGWNITAWVEGIRSVVEKSKKIGKISSAIFMDRNSHRVSSSWLNQFTYILIHSFLLVYLIYRWRRSRFLEFFENFSVEFSTTYFKSKKRPNTILWYVFNGIWIMLHRVQFLFGEEKLIQASFREYIGRKGRIHHKPFVIFPNFWMSSRFWSERSKPFSW